MSVCLNPYSIIVWLFSPVSSLKVSISQCSITETLESQVAGICTIDLFHCGFQQWLCAPQHRAPQEEPGVTHWNTIEALSCLLSRFVVVLLMLTAFCSHIDSGFSECTPYILNTLAGEIWCVCPQTFSQVFCFILTLLLSIFVSYLSEITWWQIVSQSRKDGSHQLRNIAQFSCKLYLLYIRKSIKG